eukprot:2193357-Alexandrium_andersonii.AAC.1
MAGRRAHPPGRFRGSCPRRRAGGPRVRVVNLCMRLVASSSVANNNVDLWRAASRGASRS